MKIKVHPGKLRRSHPCLQSGPPGEDHHGRISRQGQQAVGLQSFTASRQQFEDSSRKVIVLELQAALETKPVCGFPQPTQLRQVIRLAALTESNRPIYAGPFPSESAMVERVLFVDHWRATAVVEDASERDRVGWYYVRVVRTNGQLAWSSPMWFEARRA